MDFSGIIEIIYGLVKVVAVAGFSVIVPYAVKWLMDQTKIDELLGDDIVRNYLYDVLERALKAGIKVADDKIATLNTQVEIENEILGFAVNYVQDSVPDALERFGLTEDNVRSMLIARLEDALGVPSDGTLIDDL